MDIAVAYGAAVHGLNAHMFAWYQASIIILVVIAAARTVADDKSSEFGGFNFLRVELGMFDSSKLRACYCFTKVQLREHLLFYQ